VNATQIRDTTAVERDLGASIALEIIANDVEAVSAIGTRIVLVVDRREAAGGAIALESLPVM